MTKISVKTLQELLGQLETYAKSHGLAELLFFQQALTSVDIIVAREGTLAEIEEKLAPKILAGVMAIENSSPAKEDPVCEPLGQVREWIASLPAVAPAVLAGKAVTVTTQRPTVSWRSTHAGYSGDASYAKELERDEPDKPWSGKPR